MMLPFELAPSVDERLIQRLASIQAINPATLTTESYGPSVSLMSTPADIVSAYGIERKPISSLHSDDVTGGKKKRQRNEETTMSTTSTTNNTTTTNTTTTITTGGQPLPVASSSSKTGTSNNDDQEHHVSPSSSSRIQFEPFSKITAEADYQGRSFLHVPSHLSTSSASPISCRPPSRLVYGLKGHQAGVQCVKWCPPAGHLIFSADLSGTVRLWDVSTSVRKEIGVYVGHEKPIRSLQISASATRMSTASVDGCIRQWDVETGSLTETLRHPSGKPCLTHLYHPFTALHAAEVGGDARLIIAAVHDTVAFWDVRESCDKPLRQYTGHMGAVLNISFLDGGRKLLTTSEDKTLRTWDFRVPVQIKQFADAAMHALSHVVSHPTEPFLAAQSFDNKVVVLQDEGSGKVKFVRNREFFGHNIAGSACQLQFSPDGQYLSSGDVSGALHVWRWANGDKVRSFAAHVPDKQLVSHQWHPTEGSRVVTSSWDSMVKVWN